MYRVQGVQKRTFATDGYSFFFLVRFEQHMSYISYMFLLKTCVANLGQLCAFTCSSSMTGSWRPPVWVDPESWNTQYLTEMKSIMTSSFYWKFDRWALLLRLLPLLHLLPRPYVQRPCLRPLVLAREVRRHTLWWAGQSQSSMEPSWQNFGTSQR